MTDNVALSDIRLQVCTLQYFDSLINELASLLHACVLEGNSINFILPFSVEEARAWWEKQRAAIEDGSQVLMLALAGNGSKSVAGCVIMAPAVQPNQPQRAEVKKMLVHPDYRRRGIGRTLLQLVEHEALKRGRWLLNLDTEVGSSGERLYISHGYVPIGQIPEFALTVDGSSYKSAVFMYKLLKKPGRD